MADCSPTKTPPPPGSASGVTAASDDLLRGAGEIAVELYGEDTPATRRRVYHEQDRWPVFRLDDDNSGVLYGLRSRLRAFLAAKSAAREAAIAANSALTGADLPKSKPLRRRVKRAKAVATKRRLDPHISEN